MMTLTVNLASTSMIGEVMLLLKFHCPNIGKYEVKLILELYCDKCSHIEKQVLDNVDFAVVGPDWK